ncbi:FYN-binding protein 2 [Talpa occidentalis]|uniref:FYN-binding protein 2 n=1 Tax=Talpa occidentalis TaxID=50954 RepID=UPI0023F90376|nr:FYN-binding protein 2 [Talpa occidentalis]
MEAGVRPAGAGAGGGNAAAPGEGGAAAQVGQVRSLRPGVSRATGSGCSPVSADRAKRTLGPRIQRWEARFVSQKLPRRKAMEGEGLINFQELRARFQNPDASSLPGLMKFPAGVSQKPGSTQLSKIWANGKPLSSSHNQLPSYCPSTEPQTLKPQKMEVVQRSEVQKCPNSPGPPGRTTASPVNLQNASVVIDVNSSDAEITKKKTTNSFRDKLWNWEKVSSQKSEMPPHFLHCGRRAFHLEEQKSVGLPSEEHGKKLEIKQAETLPSQRHLMAQRNSITPSEDSTFLLSQHDRKSLEMLHPKRSPGENTYQPVYESELTCQDPEKQPDVKHHQLPKTKPLPSIESLGPPPRKPPKPPVVDLQAFQRLPAAVPKTHREAAMKEGNLPPQSAEFEEPHNYEATISYLRHSGNSINLCSAKEIADSTYEVGIEELKKPWKSFLHQELSPKHADEDQRTKEKEPRELEPQRIEKDPHSNHISKTDAYEGTPRAVQTMKVHMRRSVLDGKQDVIHTKACPEDPKLARHSQGQCGYVEALEVTSETPGQGVFKRSSISEEMYDDVEYPGREGAKSDFSNSFASDNEENSEEMYEDVYKTKSNYPNLDGKEALKRLQRFFKKEKDRFKMKKTKSKENVRSAFSISLPDLQLRSQEVIIYDDVGIHEKGSKDEDKLKTRKPKFLTPKEKKEKKGAVESESLSPTNFFRIKKQNLKKNRLEKEEKLFREKFEYDKDITVINTAVACSNNSRNGIFDLPITPGEELDVIDVTEENLVICRNSKGKYGYVLIEHLDFKHQGWSP